MSKDQTAMTETAYGQPDAVDDSGAVVTAGLIIIGNEILSGRTRDANLPYIAEALGAAGIRMREVRIIPDDREEIVAAVRGLSQRFTYVFTTGGIGPTHDDITAACVAEAMGSRLERNAEALRRLEVHYDDPSKLNSARLRMANIPVGASLIDNPVSAAPGFILGNVHVLPGVPKILQAMIDGLVPNLTGGEPVLSRTLVCSSPEGNLAEALGHVQDRYPSVEMGSYPYMRMNNPGTSLVFRSADAAALNSATAEMAAELDRLAIPYRLEEGSGRTQPDALGA